VTTTATKKIRIAAANDTTSHQSYVTGALHGEAPEPHRQHNPATLAKTSNTGPKGYRTMGPVTLVEVDGEEEEDVEDNPAKEEEAEMEEGGSLGIKTLKLLQQGNRNENKQYINNQSSIDMTFALPIVNQHGIT